MAKRKPARATEKPARAVEPGAGDSSAGTDSRVATEQQQATSTAQAQQEPGNADSDAATEQDTEPGQAQDAATRSGGEPAQAAPQAMGNVHGLPTASDGPISYHRTRERLMKHAEWGHIIGTVKEMRIDPKLAKMRAEHRERFIWGEMDRLYPAKPQEDGKSDTHAVSETPQVVTPAPLTESGRIQGLAELPASWTEIPANVSLAAEVAWVQAERLRIVEEKPSGATVVSLERARSPAPSWAALSWLETSIRSYAKFVEVAAKVSGSNADEQANIKRERMAIDEIRSILSQMQG